MKFDENKNKKLREEITQLIEDGANKTDAIVQAIERFNTETNQQLINQLQEEAQRASHDKEFKETLGLRTLSKKEKEFYEMLKNPQQAITAKQIDIIPTETIDYTLMNIKKKSRLSELISFTPSNVKKWITASSTGKAKWGKLFDPITGEIDAKFETIDYELGKLFVSIIIPKAINDLSLEFVDKYFTAVLNDVMNDGIESGYLNGTGVDMPIGVFKKVDDFNTDKTAKDKTVLTSIIGFSPKQLAPVLVALSNDGLRSVPSLAIVCNPKDKFSYVLPALYGETREGGYTQKTFLSIDIIDTPNCPEGKAGFTMPGYYTMGFSGLKVDEYKETKALDDANLIIAKVYGNGRALDNNVFIPFDPTKLEEFVPNVKVKGTVSTKAAA